MTLLCSDVAIPEHDAHLHNLKRVSREHDLVFNSKKSAIKAPQISFFGIIYDENGVHPDPKTQRWPDKRDNIPKPLRRYWCYRDELSVEDGLTMKGERVVIPESVQPEVLERLHAGHQIIEKCKLRAKSCIYWDGINEDLEEMVKRGPTCQELRKSNAKETLKPQEVPTRAWQILGTYLFHFNDNEYLIIADYYSKYPFVRTMPKSCTSHAVVAATKGLLSEQGVPEKIISDNGRHSDCVNYRSFAETWGFNHITSSPQYPQSNGFIERFIQTVKTTLTKARESQMDPDVAMLCLRTTAIDHSLPSPIKLRWLPHLEAESYTSRSIQLNWTQPEGFDPDRFDVIYEIQYEGQWDNEPKVTFEVSNHLTHMLTNLHPYTLYNVSIRCRLDASHFWSDPLTTQVTTAEEAPSVSPTIPPGSFRIQPCSRDDDSYRNVTVFFQSVMKEYRNGVILRYRVLFHKVHHLTSSVLWVNASSLSATLTGLDPGHGYIISVEACNSAGRSPTAIVSITDTKHLPLPPADLVAERSETWSHIAFSWAPPSPSLAPVNNYTFFWCERLAHSKHECQGPLHYRIIAGNVTEIDHLVTHDADVYALSANSDSGSSGMSKDWICVYDYDGLPGKPVFSFDGGVGARNVTLSWQPPSCSPRNRGRVVSYMLELWKEGSEACDGLADQAMWANPMIAWCNLMCRGRRNRSTGQSLDMRSVADSAASASCVCQLTVPARDTGRANRRCVCKM
ncbi:hypothetical protein LSAT2_018869, partial [Lamellibrachia satsuma]